VRRLMSAEKPRAGLEGRRCATLSVSRVFMSVTNCLVIWRCISTLPAAIFYGLRSRRKRAV
jgi:hypothetical protein